MVLFAATLLMKPEGLAFQTIKNLSHASHANRCSFPLLLKENFQRSKKENRSYTKPVFNVLGGRWDLNPRPLEPQSSALTS